MSDNRSIYVMLPLRSEDECQLYKPYARRSGLKGVEIVVEITPLSDGEITVYETDLSVSFFYTSSSYQAYLIFFELDQEIPHDPRTSSSCTFLYAIDTKIQYKQS
jgi:hypothetical protein